MCFDSFVIKLAPYYFKSIHPIIIEARHDKKNLIELLFLDGFNTEYYRRSITDTANVILKYFVLRAVFNLLEALGPLR